MSKLYMLMTEEERKKSLNDSKAYYDEGWNDYVRGVPFDMVNATTDYIDGYYDARDRDDGRAEMREI